jgi:hypothetical protein
MPDDIQGRFEKSLANESIPEGGQGHFIASGCGILGFLS